MKLLFLYIEDFRVHKGVSINFDTNERFQFRNGKLSPVEQSAEVPDDFFHIASRGRPPSRFVPTSRVDCVSAIIGKNGTGKTSIAEMLNRAFSRGRTGEGFLYVCKLGDRYFCRENLRATVDVSDVENKVGRDNWDFGRFVERGVPGNLGMIYYSPYYSPREDWFIGSSDGFVDISAVGRMAGKVPKEYDLDEARTIDRFTARLAVRLKNVKKEAPLPCPGKLTMTINRSYIESTYREVASKASEMGRSDNYDGEFRIEEDPYAVQLAGQSSNVVRTKEDYQWTLWHILQALALSWTGDFLLQVIAGLVASCVRKYGLGYEAFRGNVALVKLAYLGAAIIRKVCGADAANHGYLVDDERIGALWKELNADSRQNVRKFAIKCARSTLPVQSYSIAFSGHMQDGDSHRVNRNDGLLLGGISAFVDDISPLVLDMPPSNENGTIEIELNDKARRKAYYSFRKNYERLQRDLFLDDSGSFISFSAVGMSSGEKAYLSMLGRIDEVLIGNKSKRGAIAKNWILFLDEAETALHPEWQRALVENIIWYVETFTRNLHVHVIFASHSPTLLSDIPEYNVIYLDGDTVSSACGGSKLKTFGANIFDLYRVAFNQQNGPVGTFAKRKIDEALKTLAAIVNAKMNPQNRWRDKGYSNPIVLQEVMRIIKLVGDPLIKRYIKSLRDAGLI